MRAELDGPQTPGSFGSGTSSTCLGLRGERETLILPALLAGAWVETEAGDRSAVEQIAGIGYR